MHPRDYLPKHPLDPIKVLGQAFLKLAKCLVQCSQLVLLVAHPVGKSCGCLYRVLIFGYSHELACMRVTGLHFFVLIILKIYCTLK